MKKWFLYVMLIVTCLGLTGCSENQGVGPEGISLDEYNQIDIGMSQFEVNEIVGGGGEKIGEQKEEHIYSYTYEFPGEKSGSATITFTADYSDGDFFVMPSVSAKEQQNLN